ncbi:MAG TPA: hypothetical protein VHG72_14090 [Polyangia bacterium]|nr:hypothetical protein [Polyangia bacterium]
MKRLLPLLAFVIALSAGCTTTGQHLAPVGIGGSGIPNQWIAPANPVTGNSATIVVFDSTATPTHADRIVVSCFFNQGVTVLYQVQHAGSATWRTTNGSGSGDTVTASTQTYLDYPIQGANTRVEVVTGSTGPTTSEVDIGLMYERTKAN